MSAGPNNPDLQLHGQWTLTKIADTILPKHAGATMTVTADQVEIDVGCNKITAVPMFGPSFFQFRSIRTTEETPSPEIRTLEAQVIEALARIKAMQIGAGDDLSFYDGMNALQIGAQRTP